VTNLSNDAERESKAFKYEVAFSFLAPDEALATQLNDLVADRLSTFLYSKRQGELAGRDGELRFGEIFGQESRIVVVLYRPRWGQTPWTRIEEAAIRDRAFNEGYEFVFLVPLDKPPTKPAYFPKPYLYAGLERWGVEGVAAALEDRVNAAGGIVRQETAAEHAQRLKRKQQRQAERARYLGSERGVSAANEQSALLVDELEQLTNRVSSDSGFQIKCRRWGNGSIEILCSDYCMAVEWRLQYSNTLDGANLFLDVYRGLPRRPGRMIIDEGRRLESRKIDFDLDESGAPRWRDPKTGNSMDVKQLADHIIRSLLSRVEADGDDRK
jgi:hypothetical protein